MLFKANFLENISAAASGAEAIEPPPMEYKKWGLLNQDQITDHCSAGEWPDFFKPCYLDRKKYAKENGGKEWLMAIKWCACYWGLEYCELCIITRVTVSLVLVCRQKNSNASLSAPGLVTPNSFDQMLNASMLGGYTATIKPTPPVASVYASAGQGPTVGFYYAIEVRLNLDKLSSC